MAGNGGTLSRKASEITQRPLFFSLEFYTEICTKNWQANKHLTTNKNEKHGKTQASELPARWRSDAQCHMWLSPTQWPNPVWFWPATVMQNLNCSGNEWNLQMGEWFDCSSGAVLCVIIFRSVKFNKSLLDTVPGPLGCGASIHRASEEGFIFEGGSQTATSPDTSVSH